MICSLDDDGRLPLRGVRNRGPTIDCSCHRENETLMLGCLLHFKTVDCRSLLELTVPFLGFRVSRGPFRRDGLITDLSQLFAALIYLDFSLLFLCLLSFGQANF
jgi:hypothetical protein